MAISGILVTSTLIITRDGQRDISIYIQTNDQFQFCSFKILEIKWTKVDFCAGGVHKATFYKFRIGPVCQQKSPVVASVSLRHKG